VADEKNQDGRGGVSGRSDPSRSGISSSWDVPILSFDGDDLTFTLYCGGIPDPPALPDCHESSPREGAKIIPFPLHRRRSSKPRG